MDTRRALPLAAIAAALLMLAGASTATNAVLHPFLAAQPKAAPEEANLAVEIPAGSFTKYEIKEDGLVHVDR
ncbi:MAG TPA: pyrophosphatase, partial [Stenotrophomonas sp.]|nr:pyrophosphatase [Stenotrophomonas sp.]